MRIGRSRDEAAVERGRVVLDSIIVSDWGRSDFPIRYEYTSDESADVVARGPATSLPRSKGGVLKVSPPEPLEPYPSRDVNSTRIIHRFLSYNSFVPARVKCRGRVLRVVCI